ncbi:hypothetical protein CMK10_14740 [Candidatus Poribacteria bacterium]|nr:hypothetical protein [Candidatus Poribacteria bacterium]
MDKRIVIALMLMLSVFVFVGCSSDDETEDSKTTADVGPTTSAVEDTGPVWPQTVYIAAGMDDLNNQKLPGYLKEDLELVSAKVTVETPDSKWEITEGEKVYEVEYSNFENDAEDAKARFKKFVAVYNGGEAAEVDKEWDGGTLWIDGEKYKGRKSMQQMQKLLRGIAAAPGVAAAPQQPGGGNAVIEKWKPTVWEATYVSGTTPDYLYAWLEASSGLGSRSKTWIYLSKSTDADSEWEIDELQTGKKEDFKRKNWKSLEPYKIE